MEPGRLARRNDRETTRGRFWYPVLDSRMFDMGDVIWIEDGPSAGRHEVRAVGEGELLVRPIPAWEFWMRRRAGRVRRWWLRLKRRVAR